MNELNDYTIMQVKANIAQYIMQCNLPMTVVGTILKELLDESIQLRKENIQRIEREEKEKAQAQRIRQEPQPTEEVKQEEEKVEEYEEEKE